MDLKSILKKYFGYDEFRKGQQELIEATVNGRDVLGIMPTGGGKSLCYQLPAMAIDGVTIVVSPLISLMKDQVDALNEIGISATYINSTQTYEELTNVFNDISREKYKIVYVAPERLSVPSFLNLIKYIKISFIAIDEAHCISQWGHDFRPSYLEIPKFIESINPRPPVSAFTATATKQIVEEIKRLIGLNNPVEEITGFDRPNLYYQVLKVSKKFKHLLEYLNSSYEDQSGIIYCATRKTVESVAKKLEEEGFSAVAYHGGMRAEDRQRNQDDFILGNKKIIVATNAFGMGIDKPDVRFVIHYNMPKNMEAYYQEAGRAGRDGEKSDCILMYSPADIVKQKLIIQSNTFDEGRQEILYKNLQYLIDYCNTNDCLRNEILNYFGERTNKENCQNCSNCLDESEMVDITIEAQKILSCIYRLNQRYGVNTVIQVLRGSRNKRLLEARLDNVSTYGIMKDYSNHVIREIIMTLTSKGYAQITADKYPILKLTEKSKMILKGKTQVFHKKDLIHNKADVDKKDMKSDSSVSSYDKGLFEELRELRLERATEKGVPPYVIFHDRALKEMAAYIPKDKESFLEIKGVGDKKYESYGEEFIKLIEEYCKINDIKPLGNRNKNNQSMSEVLDSNNPNLDRYELTYNLYLKDISLQEISEKRGFTKATIIKHLKRCEDKGKDVNWSKFIDDMEIEEMIIDKIEELGNESLKTIKDALPENITYEDIHLVIYKHNI
ncbi:DNA helicase RecQ [Sporosalibacterium faouarense]|uniref:DNA helicase RecQ n=1 Tax=Sporosalibacterium faouarense TaxID=516123 RepID=UPI00141C26F8|nr:DNA helicase RecQ [Sporosalibacterium faouarense]MTI46547.1 DNA helicase RecQ [Bacillota bacterium]